MRKLVLALLLSVLATAAQAQDSTGSGTTLPATCTVGDRFIIDGVASWYCYATDTWRMAVAPTNNYGVTSRFLRGDWTWAKFLTPDTVTADVSSTDGTNWADITGLPHTVLANTTYNIECALFYSTAISTTTLQLSFNGPVSPTAFRYAVEISTGVTTVHGSSQTAYQTVTDPVASGGATVLPARVTGTFENGSTAGSLNLQLRTGTNTSTVTVKRGSWCAFY